MQYEHFICFHIRFLCCTHLLKLMNEVISRESVVSLKDFPQLERMIAICPITVDIVYLDFSNIIDSVSHNILIGILGKFEIDEWTVR